ncbi:hypothetical protein KQ304_05135 [Synechococcus sp. CS-1329]|uniref:hypothetical protein n=1 Tax=Synechococcus sp. CS-1329 TaxID=2847975 RepID=UPI00223B0FBD|nr:hypothetical protein [Synechococcus sp. CS-1329]MCT0218390.1 hypothetical protein [Synechococcus sp. CS-1329]
MDPTRAVTPDAAELLRLEAISRRRGGAVEPTQLIGSWRLQRTWPRGSERPADLASGLLRAFGARLVIGAPGPGAELTIRNSVQLGGLQLTFVGQARLEGKRPLLLFRFERLRLALGPWQPLDRPLPQPLPFEQQRAGVLPFFALIGGGSQLGWLAARGRGGGLALWSLDGADDSAHGVA